MTYIIKENISFSNYVNGWEYAKEIENEEKLFPKWEELGRIKGYWINDNKILSTPTNIISQPDNENVFSTKELARASLATARVSQTYRRYRELVRNLPTYIIWQVEATVIREFGLLRMTFANSSDWEMFYEANKEDLDLIIKVTHDIQL